MLQLVPRHVFDHIVDTHSWAGPKPRTFSYWSQFGAMLYAQFSSRKSLRDLVFSLDQHVKKLYHLGQSEVKRSTLAEANEQCPAIIFEEVYHKLLHRFYSEMTRNNKRQSKIKILDSTTIDLCASVFPWTYFRARKAGIKLHTVITDMLPKCVILTEAKIHDMQIAKTLQFDPGDLLIFDRGYIDYAWLHRLHQKGVWFVTRLKSNACFEVIETLKNPAPDRVLTDEIIRLNSEHGLHSYQGTLRRVHYRDPETGKEYVFLTNRFDLSALAIADLYRQRWQIELFFKWVKQNLKIKTFYGTSRNAVLIQIWTALIAYLLLIWLKIKTTINIGILESSRLIQATLMERRSLWETICPKKRPPTSINNQMDLLNYCAGH
ncbi:IS4 family transposase [Desulfobacca acetoxidans]|uniref:IS4 family transposase n=1 Tax=Desulfobacca acetoxidans TaxID=60893 RepID=UPI00059D2460|nr:IS4 family transposase [Desulfobacca acetoxidans]